MGNGEQTTLFVGFIILGVGIAVSYFFGVLSFNAVLIAFIFLLFGFVAWGAWKSRMFQRMTDVVDQQHGGWDSSKSIDDLWADLQEWAAEDPREMELKWNSELTDFQMISIESSDGDSYSFTSIITPVKQASKEKHICIENTTGLVIAFRRVKFEEERKYPFRYIALVEELRRQQMSSGEILTRLQQSSMGQLQGNYPVAGGTPIDRDIQSSSNTSDDTGGEED